MPDDEIKLYLIDLSNPPPVGPAHMIIRTSTEERETIQLAASLLQMTQADFIRGGLSSLAKKVIQEKRADKHE